MPGPRNGWPTASVFGCRDRWTAAGPSPAGYIIPLMSGMPPPPPPSFSGASAMIASVVRMFLAIDAAFCSAERHHGGVNNAGGHEVLDLAGLRVEAVARRRPADVVDDDRALEAGVLGDLAERLLERAQHAPLTHSRVVSSERDLKARRQCRN